MAVKRLTRKFTDVVAEVERQLKAHYEVTDKDLKAWRDRATALVHSFPLSTMVEKQVTALKSNKWNFCIMYQ